ncbi:uncharacterized protein LOC114325786 [Diabrotica virgifera virgifera]|uniref:Uncharacterized protein LOC114325786 n=1 Tax=Diabrotica virgifera virgifera TaxID=50390 RepID=A0A6P7F8C5_DIAVI|nr:uncharacterized protein LOC114325786 [Diabrotica virgifera virgifera]
MTKWLLISILLLYYCTHLQAADNDLEDPPEGYYAFIESPNAEPPRVRPPPYTHVLVDCREDDSRSPQGSLFNLCGDLNKGTIPKNPMGQNVLGSPYPFELIRNMTLKYLSRTLPILKADETLPKVAQLQDDYINQNSLYTQHPNDRNDRSKRSANSTDPPATAAPSTEVPSTNETSTAQVSSRQARKFCDQGGVFCMLYKAINGESNGPSTSQQLPLERRDEAPLTQPRYEGPPTPCPAKVEYATPVFAKNYQGVWRYVVQIPYEGYFTQTVEVTRCLQARCHYLDGGCLSSPRWSSLLVAEIYYPDTVLSSSDTANPQRSPVAASQPPSVQDFQNYQQYLHKRAGLQPSSIDAGTTQRPSSQCDGIDALGCFQVRLYYDWFLIPGSCKCWRPDYFNKYVRRKSNTDL